MTVIALPPGHDHLAHALVRDLGYVRVHVDAAVRSFLLAQDPLVESGAVMVNMGRSPRLASRVEAHGGDWDKATLRTPEIVRLVEITRALLSDRGSHYYADRTVVVGVTAWTAADRAASPGSQFVAIEGRLGYEAGVNHLIAEGSVPEQEAALVGFVRSLDEPDGRQSSKFAEAMVMAGASSDEIEAARRVPRKTPAQQKAILADAEALIIADDPFD